MAKKAVFGIAPSTPQAIVIADRLKEIGFGPNDISVFFPTSRAPGTLRTKSTRKRLKAQWLEQAAVQSSGERWAGW